MSLLKRRTKGRHAVVAGEADDSAVDGGTEATEDVVIDYEAIDYDVESVSDDETAAVDLEKPDPLPPGSARRVLVLTALPLVALAVAATAAFFKYQAGTAHAEQTASIESVRAASDGAVAILSYHADSVEKDLDTARDRLTGSFRDDYTKLTREVVIPGSHQKSISSVASVPAAATVSTTSDHAVVLVFVDQNITVGTDPPASSSSSVRVTLDKHGDKWLISGFEPV